MVSELARGDWEDLRAQGLNPTLEDFDRLNQLALRLKDGAETTCANFPRVGWAGDVPFFEPTMQAFAWYHGFAVRAAANTETENTLWAFALAHAREPHFFDSLVTPDAIDKAASAWVAKLPVTREEVMRACRYAVTGFDDAEPAKTVSEKVGTGNGNPRHRADLADAATNLANLESRLVAACVKLHANPDDLMTETPSRLDRLCEAAAVELGKHVGEDEARLRAEYGLALREIVLRLKKEVCDCAADNGGSDRGGAIDKEVAPSPLRHGVAGSDNGAKGQAGDKVVVVEHDGHSIPQGDG